MKLEVGKTYLDRKNRKVTIIENDGHYKYPFNGDNHTSYTESGALFSFISTSNGDLISEYIEESIFRVKGTKLPSIAEGTAYTTTLVSRSYNWNAGMGADYDVNLISDGQITHNGELYISAESKSHPSWRGKYLFKESDLIKLAEEQGMEWGVKPEFVLPEKWKVLRTYENTALISKWANEVSNTTNHCGYGSKDYPNYIHSENIDTGIAPRSGDDKDFTEITFEQFKQYVLKQKTETMEKEIKGYRWKEAHKKYYKAYLSITGFNSSLDEIDHDIQFTKGSNAEKQLKEAGVLDLWFEPCYKLAYKVGDWITFLTAFDGKEIGYICKIDSIRYEDYRGESLHWIHYIEGGFRVGGNGYYIGKDFRLSTPEEIEAAQKPKEEIVNIGFDVRIKDGRAFVGYDDITEFIIDMMYTYNQTKSFGGFTVELKDITFKRTGCKSVETKLSDWKKIYDKLK